MRALRMIWKRTRSMSYRARLVRGSLSLPLGSHSDDDSDHEAAGDGQGVAGRRRRRQAEDKAKVRSALNLGTTGTYNPA